MDKDRSRAIKQVKDESKADENDLPTGRPAKSYSQANFL